MKITKIVLIVVIVLIVGAIIISVSGKSGKNSENNNLGDTNENEIKNSKDISNICGYFLKELVESAIGKPIIKAEVPKYLDNKYCDYYVTYSETYDHTPYGDKPGGAKIVVVYDDEDFAKDKISNEKSGSVYGSDASIGMDNYVIKNNIGKIWQTALILGDDKYIRIKFIDDAVTGEDLVKIAAKFAEHIK